jgi:hypothetical protein
VSETSTGTGRLFRSVRADGAGHDTSHDTTGSIIVNSSRAGLSARSGEDFTQAARRVAEATRLQLNAALPTLS